jgi:hypothetical protein
MLQASRITGRAYNLTFESGAAKSIILKVMEELARDMPHATFSAVSNYDTNSNIGE